MSDATLLGLALSGGGWSLPDYAARGLTMTMQPIEAAAQLARDINGNLIDISHAQFRKYKATVSCADQESPGFADTTTMFDGVWPGALFTVTCIPELASATALTLMMRIMSWNVSRDEYGAATSWSADFEQA